MNKYKRGFTLIELLVVILIIGVLSAVALPQYQKAILKSRFSALMPITRAVTNAQEIYYMEHGNYATDITQLDIKAPIDGVSANITVPGTEGPTRFDYVMTSRTDALGVALVMYQKHSEQFPNAVMCEANDTLNSKATWLCQTALHGIRVESGSLQGSNWTAYLLSGVASNSSFSMCSGTKPADIEASQSGAKATAYCDEASSEWKYEWTTGDTFSSGTCTGTSEYACANATFDHAVCDGRTENACANSTFKNGGYCYGSGINGCAGAIIQYGGSCQGSSSKGCRGAIIQDGGYCTAGGCEDATYSGRGCCTSCPTGSNVPKCSSYNFWDGTYW